MKGLCWRGQRFEFQPGVAIGWRKCRGCWNCDSTIASAKTGEREAVSDE
jgi:hypothetical protein